MLIGVLGLQKMILKLVETCRLSQASQKGGLGDLVKKKYHLKQTDKLEGRVPTAPHAWDSFAGCPAAVFSHEYLYIVSFVLSTQ